MDNITCNFTITIIDLKQPCFHALFSNKNSSIIGYLIKSTNEKKHKPNRVWPSAKKDYGMKKQIKSRCYTNTSNSLFNIVIWML